MKWNEDNVCGTAFGAGIGAFTNMWVTAINPWAGFAFAFFLLWVALAVIAWTQLKRNERRK